MNPTIDSNERITNLINEAKNELSIILPEIELLQKAIDKLSELNERKHKLDSLIASLSQLIPTHVTYVLPDVNSSVINKINTEKLSATHVNDFNEKLNSKDRIFYPDKAMIQVKTCLRPKNNLNYEIYKAVVFSSGIATTRQIKDYLIENNIKQPKTGVGFEEVELKEISSRANYLVRKNILISLQGGVFESVFGWENRD